MDEIDAALDFKNVSIVANYIKVCHLLNAWHSSELISLEFEVSKLKVTLRSWRSCVFFYRCSWAVSVVPVNCVWNHDLILSSAYFPYPPHSSFSISFYLCLVFRRLLAYDLTGSLWWSHWLLLNYPRLCVMQTLWTFAANIVSNMWINFQNIWPILYILSVLCIKSVCTIVCNTAESLHTCDS